MFNQQWAFFARLARLAGAVVFARNVTVFPTERPKRIDVCSSCLGRALLLIFNLFLFFFLMGIRFSLSFFVYGFSILCIGSHVTRME